MSIGLKTIAAAATAVLLAGGAASASAQPYYGYGQLPPAPYQVYGGGYSSSGCGGGDRFTLLGAHAGVTVLGVDLGAGVGLSVPTGYSCGGAQQEYYEPRPYAPVEPAPAAYGPPPQAYPQYAPQPAYAYQSYAAQSYGPPPQAYPSPCGCGATGW